MILVNMTSAVLLLYYYIYYISLLFVFLSILYFVFPFILKNQDGAHEPECKHGKATYVQMTLL